MIPSTKVTIHQGFLIAILTSLFMSSCDQGSSDSIADTTEIRDTVHFRYHETSKFVGDCNELLGACAGFSYKELHLLGGIGNEASNRIEKNLDSALFGPISNGSYTKESYLNEYLTDYQLIVKEFPDYQTPWEVDLSETVNYNEKGILGVTLMRYLNTGGAHPFEKIQFVNYDIESGKRIRWEQLFPEENQQDVLKIAEGVLRDSIVRRESVSWEKVASNWKDQGFYLPDNFRMDPEGLVFFYNPYDIASYSKGEFLILLPKEKILPYLEETAKTHFE